MVPYKSWELNRIFRLLARLSGAQHPHIADKIQHKGQHHNAGAEQRQSIGKGSGDIAPEQMQKHGGI